MIHDSMPDCDRRIALRTPLRGVRALAIVLVAGSLGAPSTVDAQQADRVETGSVLADGMVVWVRATERGVVRLFFSRGYRDAFARPHELPAAKAAAWADSAMNPESAVVRDIRSPAWSDDSLVLDRRFGADSAGLLFVREGTLVGRLGDAAAKQVVSAIAAAASLTRQLSAESAPRVVAERSAPPARAVAVRSVSAERQARAAAPMRAPVADTTRMARVTSEPPVTSEPRAASQPRVASARAASTATEAAPPPAVDSAPALDAVVPLRPSVDRESLPAFVDTTIIGAAAPGVRARARQLPPAALADVHVETPLGPFVVPGSELTSRDRQIRYCYTQLGLRYDRRLAGDLTVRVTLSSAGTPDTVEVTKRTWDGVAAAEVESCMRALIEGWTFGDGTTQVADRVVELHFTLTPEARAVAASGAEAKPAPPADGSPPR